MRAIKYSVQFRLKSEGKNAVVVVQVEVANVRLFHRSVHIESNTLSHPIGFLVLLDRVKHCHNTIVCICIIIMFYTVAIGFLVLLDRVKHCHNTVVCICIVIMFYAVATACPESVNVLAIVGGVVGGIVAVGLALLLIWKLFTFIHDRREFAKFEKERQNAKWDTVSLILLLLPFNDQGPVFRPALSYWWGGDSKVRHGCSFPIATVET